MKIIIGVTVGRFLLIMAALSVVAAGGKDPRGHAATLKRLNQLVGPQARRMCKEVGITYPPNLVVLRAFKREGELEIWAGNDDMTKLRLVSTVPICAVDDLAGPKLKPYDKKTPEGFYTLQRRYRSTLPWMWIKLQRDEIDNFGEVGNGTPFFFHLSYPSEVDDAHSSTAGFRTPRGEICLHPNCATEGCVSFDNSDYLIVHAFAGHHDESRYGEAQIHVLPFRFDDPWTARDDSDHFKHKKALGVGVLQRFWENLEEGADRFDAHPWPLSISYGPTVLHPGDRAPDVRRIKRALRDRGMYEGKLNGKFDADLEAAIESFKEEEGIEEDGVGPATWGPLGFDWKTRYLFD